VLKGRGPGAGGGAGAHLWLRLALVSSDKSAAMLFDDLTQVGLKEKAFLRSARLGSACAATAEHRTHTSTGGVSTSGVDRC
jgi:hypothetical protein